MTIVRLEENFTSGAFQVNRITWASVEAFAAAFVANMPTLYTLRRSSNKSITPNSTLMSRSSMRQETREGQIRVTQSVDLAVLYENPEVPGQAVLYGASDAWVKRS
jgi:hypothetical protein